MKVPLWIRVKMCYCILTKVGVSGYSKRKVTAGIRYSREICFELAKYGVIVEWVE